MGGKPLGKGKKRLATTDFCTSPIQRTFVLRLYNGSESIPGLATKTPRKEVMSRSCDFVKFVTDDTRRGGGGAHFRRGTKEKKLQIRDF